MPPLLTSAVAMRVQAMSPKVTAVELAEAAGKLRTLAGTYGKSRRQWIDSIEDTELQAAVEAITCAQLEGSDMVASAILDAAVLVAEKAPVHKPILLEKT